MRSSNLLNPTLIILKCADVYSGFMSRELRASTNREYFRDLYAGFKKSTLTELEQYPDYIKRRIELLKEHEEEYASHEAPIAQKDKLLLSYALGDSVNSDLMSQFRNYAAALFLDVVVAQGKEEIGTIRIKETDFLNGALELQSNNDLIGRLAPADSLDFLAEPESLYDAAEGPSSDIEEFRNLRGILTLGFHSAVKEGQIFQDARGAYSITTEGFKSVLAQR